jgi:hypothetical protein
MPADIVADQRRVQASGAEERRAYRIASPWMQVRQTDYPQHAR